MENIRHYIRHKKKYMKTVSKKINFVKMFNT